MWVAGRIILPNFIDDDSDSSENKKKKCDELLEDISTIVDFYVFLWGIKEPVESINYSTSITLRFAEPGDREIVLFLGDELKKIFKKKVLCVPILSSGSLVKIYLDPDDHLVL